VLIVPVCQTYVAKLMGASAGHMVAALGAFDEDVATGASFPVLEVLLEICVTGALMFRELTLLAKFYSAFFALKITFSHIDNPITIFSGAQS
jgi:hypothetical protein